MTITERIDSILSDKKMSRRKLAISAGIPPSTLQSAMERGTNISSDMLGKIAKVLNVSILDLYDVAPERKSEVEKNIDDVYNFWNGIGETISKDKLRALFEHDAVATEPYNKYFDAREKAHAAIKSAMAGVDEELLFRLLLEKYNSLNRTGRIVAVMLLDSLDATGDFRNNIDEE